MKKYARSRRFASYGVLGLVGVLAVTFILLAPKADQNVVSVSGGHTTEWSEQLGAGEVFSACGSSATCSSTHYNCGVGNVGTTAEYADNWQWWCLSPDGGSDILCQENKPVVGVNGSCAVSHYTCAAGTGDNQGNANGWDTSTQWNWNCVGSGGGTNAACSETKPITGTCDNTGGYQCTTGAIGTHSGNATDGWTWYCDGTPNDAAHRSVSCFYKPPAAASCPAPSPGWVGVITSGDSITAYSVPSVFSPATCPSETRICTNGTLSGSYTYSACSAITPTCANGGLSGAPCATWTNYCTGANDINGNNWQIWAYDNSTPKNYKFIETGTATNGCVALAGPSGSISASPNPCSIAQDASTCSSTITWSAVDTPNASVTIGASTFSSNKSGSQAAQWIGYTAGTFVLKDSGGNALASVSVSGSCTSGTIWNGGTCAPWVNYCTGANDINGNNWQIWKYYLNTGGSPVGWTYVTAGTVGNGCVASVPSSTDGSCSVPATHYTCSSVPASTNKVSGITAWTWTCPGTGTGTSDSCSEDKSVANGVCTGLPSGGIAWNNTAPTSNTAYTYSATNPGASVPCKYHDTSVPSYSCTGLPSGGIAWNNTAPTSNTAYTYSATNPGASVPCKYHNGTPPPSSVTANISASPVSVAYGDRSTLSWNSSNATSCSASGGPWSNLTPPTGNSKNGSGLTDPLTTNTTFSFTCNGTGGPVTDSVSVSVGSAPPPADCTAPWGSTIAHGISVYAFLTSTVITPASCVREERTCSDGTLSGSYTNANCEVLYPSIDTFSATPSRVRTIPPTNVTSVSWSTTDVTSCSVTRNGVAKWSGTSSSGKSDTITGQTVYIITCDDLDPKSVTVNVVPEFKEF